MTRHLLLLSLCNMSGCGDWSLTRRPDDACVDGACDEEVEDTSIPCEPDALPAAELATQSCLTRPDPFSSRLEWEVRNPGADLQYVGVVLSPDAGTTGPGWFASGGSQVLYMYRGDDGTISDRSRSPWGKHTVFAGDLDGDGRSEYVCEPDSTLVYWRPDGEDRIGPVYFPYWALGTAADMDGDGKAELIQADHVVAHDGTTVLEGSWERPGQYASWSSVADMDQDGLREIVMGHAQLRLNGTSRCHVADQVRGDALPTDINGDGVPEVLVMGNALEPGRDWAARILDNDCNVIAESDLLQGTGLSWVDFPGAELLVAAPLVRAGEMAYAYAALLEDDASGLWAFYLVVVDASLTPIAVYGGSGVQLRAQAADLDGDGVFELVVSGQQYGGDVRIINVRTGDFTILQDEPAAGTVIADVDNDRHAEIVVWGNDNADSYYVRSYGGAGLQWQPATTSWMNARHMAWLQNPDGTSTQEPTDWARTGFLNASPSWAWWWGVGADLVTEISDVCSTRCGEGRLTVWARLGNQGTEDVGRPVRLQLYGTRDGREELLGERVYDTVPTGWWLESEPFEVSYEGAPYASLRATVAGEGWTIEECEPSNNDATWELECP